MKLFTQIMKPLTIMMSLWKSNSHGVDNDSEKKKEMNFSTCVLSVTFQSLLRIPQGRSTLIQGFQALEKYFSYFLLLLIFISFCVSIHYLVEEVYIRRVSKQTKKKVIYRGIFEDWDMFVLLHKLSSFSAERALSTKHTDSTQRTEGDPPIKNPLIVQKVYLTMSLKQQRLLLLQ